MTAFEEYKVLKTHKDKLLKSWWENIGKWKAPDKTTVEMWNRLRNTK